MNTQDKRAELIAGLRELADFYEQHPDLPVRYPSISYCVPDDDDVAGCAEVARIAAILGVEPTFTAGGADVERPFSGLLFRAFHVSRKRSEDWKALVSYSGAVEPEASRG